MRGQVFQFIKILILALWVIPADAQVPLQTTPFWQTTETNVYSTGMIWRDANNDGYIDVFFSNGNDMAKAQNFIYLSHYGAMLTKASWYSANAEYSGHCAVGDIDDNGYPDFAVSNYIGDGFSTKNFSDLYLNMTGKPHVYPDWRTAESLYTFSCALGDPDGDGDLDLTLATGEGYTARPQNDRIYFNIGGSLQTMPGWLSNQATEAMDVTWGDVDNDGDLDLALCYDNLPPRIHYNIAGTLEGTPSWQAIDNEPGNTLIFGDINTDGWLDLIVAFNDQNGGIGKYRVYFNNGSGTPVTTSGWQSSDGGYGSALSLYDYDNDGDDDLAAGRWWDRPRIYENTGGTFTVDPVWRANLSTVVEELAWVDIDGDGVEARADTIYVSSPKKVFYTSRHPLYSMDSVFIDGVILSNSDYCFDLVSGWVSLGQAPYYSIVIYYQYSFKNDLTVANWDTYNQAYGNNNRPYVDFYADTIIGWAPLEVHFTDSSVGASDWLWRFNDGGNSALQNPIYIFMNGGAHDIYLENTLPNGRHNRTQRKMIIAFADTVYFPDMAFTSQDVIKVPIYLRNCHPLHNFVLPIVINGPVGLAYTGHDTDSCRTNYFETVTLLGYSPENQQIAFTFTPRQLTENPDLPAGYGRIINIYFAYTGGSGMAVLDTTTFSALSLYYDADYVNYMPAVSQGHIQVTSVVRGDANHDGLHNILDITFLINYLYKGGAAPIFYEGDANADDRINILDITFLINYLYKEGPPPPAAR
jgi:PKD repeat protein